MIVSIYKKETSSTGSSVISKWRFNSFVHVELKNYISAVLAAAQSIEYEFMNIGMLCFFPSSFTILIEKVKCNCQFISRKENLFIESTNVFYS